MADHLYIEALEVDCIIGLAEWERLVRQTVCLDLELEGDLRSSARVDAVVEGGINTKAVAKRLLAFVSQTEFQLLESLAERVCELILTEFPVDRVGLRLSKPGAIRGARNVGVAISRSRSDYPL
ncbi:MAG: dihydroneopterin aldolase [Vulcanimicrobiota bacterium]